MSNNKKCTISRIVKHHNGGYGFKITFDSFAEASKYKDQAYYIINVDGYQINNVKGYSE
jgi:hypothetical protein